MNDFSFVNYVLSKGGKDITLYSSEKTHVETNPTIIEHDGFLFLNFRCIDYFLYNTYGSNQYNIRNMGWCTLRDSYSCNTFNKFKMFNKDFIFCGEKIIEIPEVFLQKVNEYARFKGLEDVRFIKWNDVVYMVGNRPDIDEYNRIVLYELNESYDIIKEIVIQEVEKNTIEKNWSPIEEKPFSFIRWTNPVQLIETNEQGAVINVITKNKKEPYGVDFRGGSETIKINNGYLSIVHTSNSNLLKNMQYNNQYRHYFVIYDNNFNIIKISKPFIFKTPDVEFCCGMCKIDNDIYITYSIKDSCSFLLKTTIDDVMDYIYSDIMNEHQYVDTFDYLKVANDYFNRKCYYSALSLYNKVFTNETFKYDVRYKSLCKYIISILEINKEYNKVYGKEIYKKEYINELIDRLILIKQDYGDAYYLKAYINKNTTEEKVWANIARNKMILTECFTKHILVEEFSYSL